jgi:hypothetical protein
MASVRSAAIVDKEKANPLEVENLIGRGEKILLPADGVKLLHLISGDSTSPRSGWREGSAAEPQPSVFCGSEFDVGALPAGEAGLGVR